MINLWQLWFQGRLCNQKQLVVFLVLIMSITCLIALNQSVVTSCHMVEYVAHETFYAVPYVWFIFCSRPRMVCSRSFWISYSVHITSTKCSCFAVKLIVCSSFFMFLLYIVLICQNIYQPITFLWNTMLILVLAPS